ncbi:UNVERIFIED_CONTAM: hypothetical protein Slati_0138300 [Sesamum latifolium]|uniref:Uncharacterized protein n=1 Tax=Sesamum latifolium TaxID=2727402 RepID=A0AAW2Y9N1_9LAMI
MSSSIASSDESLVRVLMEVPGDQDPSEATSRRANFGPFAPRSGLRQSLRQAALTARHLLDEENVEVQEGGERGASKEEGDDAQALYLGEPEGEGSSPGEEEEQRAPLPLADWGSCNLKDSDIDKLASEFHIPPPFAIYTPLPSTRPFSPPNNCLDFFWPVEVRSSISHSTFYSDVARLFQVPLNQLSPNSFRILVGFFMIFHFRRFPVTADIFAQCFRLRMAEPGLFLFTSRAGVSFLPAPSAPKNWKRSFFFVWRASP